MAFWENILVQILKMIVLRDSRFSFLPDKELVIAGRRIGIGEFWRKYFDTRPKISWANWARDVVYGARFVMWSMRGKSKNYPV